MKTSRTNVDDHFSLTKNIYMQFQQDLKEKKKNRRMRHLKIKNKIKHYFWIIQTETDIKLTKAKLT